MTIAGVHFPVDSMAGAVLGTTLAHAFHALAMEKVLVTNQPSEEASTHHLMEDSEDFTLRGLNNVLTTMSQTKSKAPEYDYKPAPAFSKLWEQAAAEWKNEAT